MTEITSRDSFMGDPTAMEREYIEKLDLEAIHHILFFENFQRVDKNLLLMKRKYELQGREWKEYGNDINSNNCK